MMCPIEIGEESELLAYSGRKLELSRAVALADAPGGGRF